MQRLTAGSSLEVNNMAQANFTPIQLYRSTTASAVPTSGNLADGELAINTNDGKLYYKDSGGTVQLIASKAGASGDVVGPASATDNAVVRFDGTTGKLVQNSVVTIADSTGDVSGVGALTASTKVVSPLFDAASSAGGQLRNAGGTSQLAWGAGGGNNLSLEVATNINPANANVSIAPTGTGTVTINPATAGTLNNIAIGGTTASTGAFTTLAASSTVTLSGGTANGVLYLNGSKVATSGSGLVFDSSGNLGLGVTPSAWGSTYRAIDIASGANGGAAVSGFFSTNIARNAYNDGTNWKAKYTADERPALYVQPYGGGHEWYNGNAFVTAGGNVTFTQALTLDASGNLLLGGTSAGASSAASLAIFNGTAPTGSVTNGIILYAEDVSSSSELKVRDEAGNVTTLSPHNFSLIPDGPSEDMAWAYYSEKGGKRINVDMLKLARMVEKLTGEKLVYES